ncbi:MAG: DUF1272 domain-containing protein [Flavobacteriaceae bacterium]|nr:DUF1272 domain-containing protein [Bacteroidia bacterium]NNL61407.1 DUF1272 domain-containing protein [Flavobacteriaceae bacterium]
MLEIRPTCEHCNTPLPYDSEDAMICTFECTYCKDCVQDVLQDVCPNCGGNFVERPIRPSKLLDKYPASKKLIHKLVDLKKHREMLKKR